jgi:outer membrane protein TolC
VRPSIGLSRTLIGTVAAACFTAATAGAQEVRVPTRELATDQQQPAAGAIDLATAVQRTLRQSPDLLRSRLAVQEATGQWQFTRGIFDSAFSVTGSFGYTQQPITPGLRGRERDKRDQLRIIAESFTIQNTQIRENIAGTRIEPAGCPADLLPESNDEDPFGFRSFDLIRDPLESTILGVSGGLRNVIIPELAEFSNTFSINELCSGELAARRGNNRRLWEDASLYGPIGLDRVLNDFPQFPGEIQLFGQELSEAIAARARLGLERLGGIPYGELRENFLVEAGYTKPFRNGMAVGADMFLQSTAHHFLDKPLDPSFGGFEQPNRFPSRVTLSLSAPLGRGRGRTSVTANEVAATHLVSARRADLVHTASTNVLRTVQAYLELVAALQRQRLLEESALRQRQFTEMTDSLVQSGDLPASENNRAQARQAAVQTSVSQAKTEVLNARMRLADAMGVPVTAIDQAPLPSGQFVETLPSIPEIAPLLQGPLTGRSDVLSISRSREAAAVLAAASRDDLRPRFDFSINGGMGNVYESPLFAFMPDERQPIISPTPEVFPGNGVRFATPRGFYRSLTGRWEPFVFASLAVELPFGNSRARGRLVQSQATLSSAEIQAVNLDRVARENIVASEAALRRAAQAVESIRGAVAASQRSLESTMEQLKAGEATLFNTLRTEEDLVTDRLQLVAALNAFYQTLARLRYEAGTLIMVDGQGADAETVAFDPSVFVTGGR